jgi:hypothetical protein
MLRGEEISPGQSTVNVIGGRVPFDILPLRVRDEPCRFRGRPEVTVFCFIMLRGEEISLDS